MMLGTHCIAAHVLQQLNISLNNKFLIKPLFCIYALKLFTKEICPFHVSESLFFLQVVPTTGFCEPLNKKSCNDAFSKGCGYGGVFHEWKHKYFTFQLSIIKDSTLYKQTPDVNVRELAEI